jgi:hypothetical protein
MRRLLLLPLLLVLAPAALAQSAEEVMREALARYESEMAGIRDYTLTQEVIGNEVTTYAERTEGGGPLAYTYFVVTPGGLYDTSEGEGHATANNPFLMLDRVADEARYVGKEDVGGVRSHVLAVDDFGDIAREAGAIPPQADGEFDIDEATFYLGTDDYRLRKMTMEGTMTNDGRTSPVRFETVFSDFRTVDGFTTPFRTEMTMRGMEGQMSDAEREDARRQLEEARKQMEQMPPAQRQMMERMMGDQLEKLEQMLGGEGFAMEIVVTDVAVNTGRPE